MTVSALWFIGALAALATLGLFYQFADRWTGVLVEFAAAALWGLFAISSMDVIVRQTAWATASEPLTPLVYLGIGMGLATLVYALYDLFQGAADEANDSDLQGLGQ